MYHKIISSIVPRDFYGFWASDRPTFIAAAAVSSSITVVICLYALGVFVVTQFHTFGFQIFTNDFSLLSLPPAAPSGDGDVSPPYNHNAVRYSSNSNSLRAVRGRHCQKFQVSLGGSRVGNSPFSLLPPMTCNTICYLVSGPQL